MTPSPPSCIYEIHISYCKFHGKTAQIITRAFKNSDFQQDRVFEILLVWQSLPRLWNFFIKFPFFKGWPYSESSSPQHLQFSPKPIQPNQMSNRIQPNNNYHLGGISNCPSQSCFRNSAPAQKLIIKIANPTKSNEIQPNCPFQSCFRASPKATHILGARNPGNALERRPPLGSCLHRRFW